MKHSPTKENPKPSLKLYLVTTFEVISLSTWLVIICGTFFNIFWTLPEMHLCTTNQFDAFFPLFFFKKHLTCTPKFQHPMRNSSLDSKPAACGSYPPPIVSPALMTCGRKHQKLPMETDEKEGLKRENTELFLQTLQLRLQISAKLLVSHGHPSAKLWWNCSL